MYLKTPNKFSIIAIATIAIVAAGLIAIPAMEQANALIANKKGPLERTLDVVKRVVTTILKGSPSQSRD
jgi:hypothetical protein